MTKDMEPSAIQMNEQDRIKAGTFEFLDEYRGRRVNQYTTPRGGRHYEVEGYQFDFTSVTSITGVVTSVAYLTGTSGRESRRPSISYRNLGHKKDLSYKPRARTTGHASTRTIPGRPNCTMRPSLGRKKRWTLPLTSEYRRMKL